MKLWAGLMMLLLTGVAQAQKPSANFVAVDWYVQSVKETNIDTLAVRLTAPYTTDLEKVRAIYTWICENIQYNTDIYKPVALRAKYVPEPVDTTSEWRSADEMVAQKVLRRGKGVCEGYSRLFKVLCQYAGVEAVVVNGYVRSDYDRMADRFRTNHTWNAVRIDSVWRLVDATWAAGYMTYGDEFVQKQNDYYFLTPPDDLIRDHYPEDLRWSLLAQPPTLAEFRKMPFRSKSYLKYGIASYSPANGIVEAEVGDTVSFTINLRDAKKVKTISPDPFQDTTAFALSPSSVFIKPEKEIGDKAYYHFVVDDSTKWVHLLFNDDVILRYSVNRKQSVASK